MAKNGERLYTYVHPLLVWDKIDEEVSGSDLVDAEKVEDKDFKYTFKVKLANEMPEFLQNDEVKEALGEDWEQEDVKEVSMAVEVF
jgi:predicted house-cleaning noncanonical NTP pyrophosphatase (MazG superfamily)